MRKLIVLFIVVSTFASCGVSGKFKLADVSVTELQLTNQISNAIPELLSQQWLSNYLVQSETRPVMICGEIVNETQSAISKDVLYNALDLNIASIGKTRVIKSTNAQRTLSSDELLDSQNIKFVITLTIVPNLDEKAAECVYKVWEKGQELPVGSLRKFIRIEEI